MIVMIETEGVVQQRRIEGTEFYGWQVLRG